MSEPGEMSETLQEFSLVCERDIVFYDPGDDVVLSCQLQPAISAASMEIKWQNKSDLVCHYKDGEVIVSSGYEGRVTLSLQDLHNGNVSLTLKDVRAEQRGLYTCEVIYKGQTKKVFIFLHGRSENLRLVGPPQTISAAPGEDVILPVHLKPKISAVFMKIKWFRRDELIYQYNNGQGTANSAYENRVDLSTQELQSGNLSLTLRNAQPSDSGHYTCRVSHNENVMTAGAPLTVSDENQPERIELEKLRMKLARLRMPTERLEMELERLRMPIERLEMELERLRMPMERLRMELERLRMELPTPAHLLQTRPVLYGPPLRRCSSLGGLPPKMEDESSQERHTVELERINRYLSSYERMRMELERLRMDLATLRMPMAILEMELESLRMELPRHAHLLQTQPVLYDPIRRRKGDTEVGGPTFRHARSVDEIPQYMRDIKPPERLTMKLERSSMDLERLRMESERLKREAESLRMERLRIKYDPIRRYKGDTEVLLDSSSPTSSLLFSSDLPLGLTSLKKSVLLDATTQETQEKMKERIATEQDIASAVQSQESLRETTSQSVTSSPAAETPTQEGT